MTHRPKDMDPSNPVVVLCSQGMRAEAEHRFDAARSLFQQAWEAHQSDYEASIAAHFLARHQPSLEETLAWNQRALDHALTAPEEEVRGFFASLYLNLAHSHEMLGQLKEAYRDLALGERWLLELPESPYAIVVRDGLRRARERLEASAQA